MFSKIVSTKKPRTCTCTCTEENDCCDADNDLKCCYVCQIQGYELEFPEDSLAPMSTCHGCIDIANKKIKWICPTHELAVWMPTYPGIPVSVCQECQDIHKWPKESERRMKPNGNFISKN